VPSRQTSNGQTYNLLDVPDSLADLTDGQYANYPDADMKYDTIEVAYHKKMREFFVQTSFDYQWRDDLRTAYGTYAPSTGPLSADPIGIDYALSPNPAVPNRQKTTTYHFQFLGRYTFPADIGFAANYRYQSGFPYSPIVPDDGQLGLNLCNFGCAFFQQNLDQNRSDNVGLLNFRLDKSVKVGRTKLTGMLDIYNVTNADPVTNFSLNLGPNYKRVIAVLDPRVFQVGARLEF